MKKYYIILKSISLNAYLPVSSLAGELIMHRNILSLSHSARLFSDAFDTVIMALFNQSGLTRGKFSSTKVNLQERMNDTLRHQPQASEPAITTR